MMKPQPKREVAVTFFSETVKSIRLNATKDAAQEFESFGDMLHERGDQYVLIVDSRYDFKEVLEYIQNYG